MEAHPESDPRPQPLEEALEVARGWATEVGSVRGVLARALLDLEAEATAMQSKTDDERRHGVLVARPTWLADTERIQREVFELHPRGVAYIKEQAFAAVIEIAEGVQSLPWKASRDGQVQYRVPTQEEMERFRGEVVDLVIFAANLAVAAEFTDDTLWPAINQKAMTNVRKRRGLGKEVW